MKNPFNTFSPTHKSLINIFITASSTQPSTLNCLSKSNISVKINLNHRANRHKLSLITVDLISKKFVIYLLNLLLVNPTNIP